MELPATMMEPATKALETRANELRDMGNKYSAKGSIDAALKENIFRRRKMTCVRFPPPAHGLAW